MIRLGIWQWHVGGLSRGDLRNYAYAVQWWAFVGFAIFFWVRLMRDSQRPGEGLSIGPAQPDPEAVQQAPSGPQYRRYAMPQSHEIDATDDPERDRYNAYLRSLEEK